MQILFDSKDPNSSNLSFSRSVTFTRSAAADATPRGGVWHCVILELKVSGSIEKCDPLNHDLSVAFLLT